jgi:ferredoxin
MASAGEGVECRVAGGMPGNAQRTNQQDIQVMTMPASIGMIHPRTDQTVGLDDRFFREVNDELSDRGFLVTTADNLITWARTGSLMWMTCRDGESRPFHRRLEALMQRLPNLTLVAHLSRPRSGDHFDRLGRFTVSDIDAELLRKRARFYMCASDAMMEEVSAGLQARGVPTFEIFKERFRSLAPPALDGLVSRRIHFARSGHTLNWSPQAPLTSILAAAESAGIAIPSGCRVGQCESCAVPIKTGEVRHLVDCSELDEAYCLTCQAVPLSDLVIDA